MKEPTEVDRTPDIQCADSTDWGPILSEWMRGKGTVAYLDNFFGPHADRLSRSLNLATERQSMLIKNLTNVNIPNYKREDMDFNLKLNEAMGEDADEFDKAFSRGRVRDSSQDSSIRIDGNNVDLESEVMSIAETEHRFNALTELTSRYFSGLKTVIREGK